MRKIRSKLKRKSTNQKWKKGQSSTSNPTKTTHRDKARARLLNAATATGLTEEAVQKLNKLQGKVPPPKLPSMHSMDDMEDEDDDETVYSTATTVASFMSQYTTHTNASFNKLKNCTNLNERRMGMLAAYGASCELITQQNGVQNSTEFFVMWIYSLAEMDDVEKADSIIGLMALVIKSVPKAVLQEKFTLTLKNGTECTLTDLLMKLMDTFDKSEKYSALIDVNVCTAAVIAAQERVKWGSHALVSLLKALLAVTVHSKPKVRKAAVKSTVWLIKVLCSEDSKHPCSEKMTKYCVEHFTAAHLDGNPITVLHILGLIGGIIAHIHADDVKIICEGLLSLSTSSNVLIRMHCYEAMYTLFDSDTPQLQDVLAGKLIAAIFDLQPDLSDVRQIVAWATVLKKGYSFMSKRNPKLCAEMFPRFMQICIAQLWPQEQGEVSATATNVIREMLLDVVPRLVEFRTAMDTVITSLTTALKNPFAQCQKAVFISFATVYEVLGANYSDALKESLTLLSNRYDSEFRDEITKSLKAAVKYVEIPAVLAAIPLTNTKNEISLERAFMMLPLLRGNLEKSSLAYFHTNIIPLASSCLKKAKELKAAGRTEDAIIYERLCPQIWGIFPGFCRQPKDIENFSLIARTLGSILSDALDLKEPILDGFKQLIPSAIAEKKEMIVAKFSKNYLPILFNLYMQKPRNANEKKMKLDILNVIKLFLKITPNELLSETFANALQSLKNTKQGDFAYNQLYDIVECFSVHLRVDQLTVLFDEYVAPILTSCKQKKTENLRPEAKKAYRIVSNVLNSQNEESVRFVNAKYDEITALIVGAEQLNSENVKLVRLKCLQKLVERNIDLNSELMRQCINETVLCFPNSPDKTDQLPKEMIKSIGSMYRGRLEEFFNMFLGAVDDSELAVKMMWALNSALIYFSAGLDENTINDVLEHLYECVQSNQRMEAKSALCTLYTFAKYIARPILTSKIEEFVKNVCKMVPDTKRFCRLAYGRILKRLCRYYGAQEIIKMVPGNDLVTHKRLKKLRKELNKPKASKGGDDDSDEEALTEGTVKSCTIGTVDDDIDESDFSDDDDDNDAMEAQNEKKKHKMEVCIEEDADTILNLNDASAVANITTKSKKNRQGKVQWNKNDDIKYKVVNDKLVFDLSEKKSKKDFKAPPAPKTGVKRPREESSDSESDTDDDAKTQKSQQSKKRLGIHRTTNSGQSVASGKTAKTWKSAQTNKSSKKSGKSGKKSNVMQPYVYQPLRPQKGGNKKKRR